MTNVRFGYALLAAQLLVQTGCADEDGHGTIYPADGGDPPIATDAAMIDAAPPAPDAAVPVVGRDGFLLVAELADGKESIHAYALPELEHTGQIDDVKLASHLGAITLADGRVVTADNKHGQIIAIGIDAAGKPSLVNRVDADLGEEAVWGCGDRDLRYLAVSSGHEGTQQTANIVKLDDFSITKFGVTLNVIDGASEELHPAIAGEPLHLFASVGGEIKAWPLSEVLAGTATVPDGSVVINPGSHGPVVSHTTGDFYIATASGSGFDGTRVNMPFARTKLIPWDVDGLSSGRNARPRLSVDGRYIYGAIAQLTPEAADRWAERASDLHVVELETGSAHRASLTTGVVSKFQLSARYAFFANVSATGTAGILVDVAGGSSAFQQVIARVPLDPLTNGPSAGQATTGKEALGSAITPDGKWAFVSHGGDGKVSVIDTTSKTVVRVLQTPTSLAGGGYLFATQRGVTPVDTCTR